MRVCVCVCTTQWLMPSMCIQVAVVTEREEQEETDSPTEHIVKAIYNFKGSDADEVCGGCRCGWV